MCGRFALYSLPEAVARHFDAALPAPWPARYNIAPTSRIPILRAEDSRRCFGLARWGLVPAWAKAVDTGYSTINARAETVADKPAYRSALRRRRCLIPADGYYEWQTQPGTRTKPPYFIAGREPAPLALAGLWERWEGEDPPLESCTIIVTDANQTLRTIHDRMPVILPRTDWEAWLDPTLHDPVLLRDLLRPAPEGLLVAHPVGTYVNNARHEGPECLAAPAGG